MNINEISQIASARVCELLAAGRMEEAEETREVFDEHLRLRSEVSEMKIQLKLLEYDVSILRMRILGSPV